MKVVAILFTALLQAPSVLSTDDVLGCASPCYKTSLRLTASKMEECLQTNCGGVDLEYEFEAEMDEGRCVGGCAENGVTDPDMKEQCAQCCEEAGCLRSRARVSHCVLQHSCIPSEPTSSPTEDILTSNKEDEDEYAKEGDNMNNTERSTAKYQGSGNYGQCKQDCNNDEGCLSNCDCEKQCWRLRSVERIQQGCADRCWASDEHEEDKMDTETSKPDEESSGEGNETTFSANPCKSRCRKLRFTAGRMDACIDNCPSDDFYVRAE